MDTEKFKDLFLFGPKSKIKAGEGLKKGRFPFFTSSPTLSKWIDVEQYFDETLVFGTGGLPSIHYVNEPFATSTDCLVAIAKANKSFNIKFVYYYIYSNIRVLEQGFKGAGLKHISKTYIQNLEIPLPDLEIQEKIVAILDKTKNLIEKREKTIALFDELLCATFLEMFGDPITNSKGWKLVKLKNVILKINAGWSPVCEEKPRLNSNQIAVLKQGSVSKRFFIPEQNKTLPEGLPIKKATYAKKGDVLFSRKNTKELVGSTVYIFDEYENLLLPDTIFNLIFDKTKITGVYIFFLFNNLEFRKKIQELSSGQAVSMSNISQQKLLELEIQLPNFDLLLKFENIVNRIYYQNKVKIIQSKNQLENLIKGLSQRAFNGKLEFNTAVDLEVLLENDYTYFKENADKKAIQLLLDRLEKNELNNNKFHEQDLYDKAKKIVFELLREGEIKQVFDKKTKRVKLKV